MKRKLLLSVVVVSVMIVIAGCAFVNPVSVNDKGVFTKQAITASLIIPDSAAPVQVKSVLLHWVLNQEPSYDSIKILKSDEADSSNFIFMGEVVAQKTGSFIDTLSDAQFDKTYYFKLQGSNGEELNVYSIEFLPYIQIYSPADTVNTNDFSITWNKIVGTLTDVHVFLLNGSDTTTIWSHDIAISDTTAIDTTIQFNVDGSASDTLSSGHFYNMTITTTRGDATTAGSKLFYKN